MIRVNKYTVSDRIEILDSIYGRISGLFYFLPAGYLVSGKIFVQTSNPESGLCEISGYLVSGSTKIGYLANIISGLFLTR